MEPLTYDLIKSRCSIDIPEEEQHLLCYKNVNLHFIIIMKKILPTENDMGTITNEQRTSIKNINTCKCRANKLLVLKIVNYLTGEELNEIINNNCIHISTDIKTTTYIKNEIVYPDYFDTKPEIICGAGIHYYNSLEPCIFIKRPAILNYKYNGNLRTYRANGELHSERNFINGIMVGPHEIYYGNVDGELCQKGNFINVNMDGDRKIYYENGKIKLFLFS